MDWQMEIAQNKVSLIKLMGDYYGHLSKIVYII